MWFFSICSFKKLLTSFNAVIFKDRNRVMSLYFLVTFNLNKGASTSVAASSKTRWEKNLRPTLTVTKHLYDSGICMNGKVCVVLRYLESNLSSSLGIQNGLLGDFMVCFVFKMDEELYLKCELWEAFLNSLCFMTDAHKGIGSYRFLHGGWERDPAKAFAVIPSSPICLLWVDICDLLVLVSKRFDCLV